MPEYVIIHQIVLAALIGAMQQAIQHWFPWRSVIHQELPRVPAYVIGTLGYLVPASALFIIWGYQGLTIHPYTSLATVWTCLVASGISVVLVRVIDWVADLIWSNLEAKQQQKLAMKKLKEVIDDKAKGTF